MTAWCRTGFLLVLLALSGCGYRPLGAEPATPAAAPPTLAIPLFGNRTTEVGLETIFPEALINTFALTRAVRVLPGDRPADLVLEGKVRSIENTSVAFDSISKSSVRRVTLRIDLVLREQKGGKVIWKDTEVLQEDYVVDPYYHAGEATKSEGIRRAAINMARRVKNKVLLVI